jgi:hypothetical protein
MADNKTGPEALIEADPQTDLGPPIPPEGSNPALIAKWVLISPEAYATTLLVLFFDQYGNEGLQWHPKTIRMQLSQDLCEPSDVNFDKLMAAITLVTSNYFYKNLPKFMDLCHALCGHGFDTTQVRLPDAAEMAWAISEAMIICPPEGPWGKGADGSVGEPYCEEIQHFIGAVLREEGFITPPDVLKIAEGADLSDQVKTTFADDPEMFSAIYQSQNEKTQEVNTLLRDGLTELMEQVQHLPIKNGSAASLAARLSKDIRPD